MLKKFLPFLPVLLLAGCTSATFTRLSPDLQPRNSNNLYPVEVEFNSQQEALRWDSIKPFVVANGEAYELRPVPVVENRWEGLLPVPATENEIKYRFKFDYLYNNFNTVPQPNSESSPNYILKITDEPQ